MHSHGVTNTDGHRHRQSPRGFFSPFSSRPHSSKNFQQQIYVSPWDKHNIKTASHQCLQS